MKMDRSATELMMTISRRATFAVIEDRARSGTSARSRAYLVRRVREVDGEAR